MGAPLKGGAFCQLQDPTMSVVRGWRHPVPTTTVCIRTILYSKTCFLLRSHDPVFALHKMHKDVTVLFEYVDALRTTF